MNDRAITPHDMMLHLAYLDQHGFGFAREATQELISRFPELDVERDYAGRVVIGDDHEIAARDEIVSRAIATARKHRPVPFQGKTYCTECRAPFWPREAVTEALWPCAVAVLLGVRTSADAGADHA